MNEEELAKCFGRRISFSLKEPITCPYSEPPESSKSYQSLHLVLLPNQSTQESIMVLQRLHEFLGEVRHRLFI